MWDGRFKVSRSFIYSVIEEIINQCHKSLKEPDDFLNLNNSDELFRKAGQHFIYKVASIGKNIDGLHSLFNSCNEISSMKYEGTEGLGKMIVAKKDHQNVKMTLELSEPISMRNYRKVRKFLELSDNESSIICDSAQIFGLGKKQESIIL